MFGRITAVFAVAMLAVAGMAVPAQAGSYVLLDPCFALGFTERKGSGINTWAVATTFTDKIQAEKRGSTKCDTVKARVQWRDRTGGVHWTGWVSSSTNAVATGWNENYGWALKGEHKGVKWGYETSFSSTP
ncbi:hypothetical protein ABZU25_19245 [Micromonospora sp. NPDC005215]|uniref:hypothetical protein n=1 Tax=Micromonospora sp. NPDC005215 TaxID=3157024 RepID=UPI0033ACC997